MTRKPILHKYLFLLLAFVMVFTMAAGAASAAPGEQDRPKPIKPIADDGVGSALPADLRDIQKAPAALSPNP